jgi:hypothetical protein
MYRAMWAGLHRRLTMFARANLQKQGLFNTILPELRSLYFDYRVVFSGVYLVCFHFFLAMGPK